MFDCVLIANRGEIAVRIIRACQELGVRAVAVHSEADREAPHVRAADAAVEIGPAPARDSYLKVEAILDAARSSGAEAIHPGYGFLSEDAGFARAVTDAGLTFIGPPPEVLAAVGDKSQARRTARSAGVSIVPGFDADGDRAVLADEQRLVKEAHTLGFPLLIKALAGGGGKGMRVVNEESELEASLAAARREAKAAFGEPSVLLERLVTNPRHIEVQILASGDTVLALGERECSVQRRHQKVVEEAPAPGLSQELRAKLLEDAVRMAKAVGYQNAGTVEFLVDGEGNHYFLEVNARLQVEHPVTEVLTGVDLVAAQLRIASGDGLDGLTTPVPRGHVMEFRIYAEDAANGFLPSTGTVTTLEVPRGPRIRLDSGIEVGSEVGVHYDPMLAKLIVWGSNREEALATARWALDHTHVGGLVTVLPFLRALVRDADYTAGKLSTDMVDRVLGRWDPAAAATPPPAVLAAAAAAVATRSHRPAGEVSGPTPSGSDPWLTSGAWRTGQH